MRVLLGLAALAASVNGQFVTPSGGNGALASFPPTGQTALAQIQIFQTVQNGVVPAITGNALGAGITSTSSNWAITVPNAITTVVFVFKTNTYTAQIGYRWGPAQYYTPTLTPYGSTFNGATYTCDPCSGGTPVSCNPSGPAYSPSPSNGFPCSSVTRVYTFSGLVTANVAINSFAVVLLDTQINPAPDVSSYSFTITRAAPTVIVGDPQIVGMQGQDFQVHGVPDEIFNIVTYPTLQINARFTYLESGACHDNFTACFAHPGTYITEEGFRVGKDKVRVSAGSFKKGLTVHVNGKKIKSNTDLKTGAIEIVSHRRVVVHTDIMRVAISNSDNFMNQELELMDDKLISLGAQRVTLKDNQKFHSEVPLHGLQGQTWRNVEYASGLEYEGSIMDYHVVDGNLFGTDFVFNQFQS